jgi:hypothetical protein
MPVTYRIAGLVLFGQLWRTERQDWRLNPYNVT